MAINWKGIQAVLKAITDVLLVGRQNGWWERRQARIAAQRAAKSFYDEDA